MNVFVTDKYHRVATKVLVLQKQSVTILVLYYHSKRLTEAGYDEIVFLNASNENIIDEARSANIFVLKDRILKTPPIDGSILPGITRDSVLKIGKKYSI